MSNQWDEVTPEERFWAKVRKSDGCWGWRAAHDTRGYGILWLEGKWIGAHRFSYELLVGPIPEGLEIDHLCQNKGCVNPAHLEPVTHLVNTRRGLRNKRPQGGPRKTHCKWGHLYSSETTPRSCRECANRRNREHRYRQHLVRAGETLLALIP